LVHEFNEGRFDDKFKRIFDIDSSRDESDSSSGFEWDCFDESEEEKKKNRSQLRAYMIEALLMKYKIYLPERSLCIIE